MIGIVLAAGSTLQGQSPARQFDAVSITRNRSGAAASDTSTTPGRLSLINVTPIALIRRAFGVLDQQIAGAPSWVSTERYDIIAVTGDGNALSDRDRQPFIQALLSERWNFRFHRDSRELPVYALVRAKDGSRLTTHTGPRDYAMRIEAGEGGRRRLRSTSGNMTRLVEILSGQTGTLVTNETGLTGEYDFLLEWVPDETPDVAGPSLFTAIQEQLGLKLEPAKRQMPAIVIDRIERPTEN